MGNDVFAIPELAEKILLNLPIKELLANAQRVCKSWHTIIEHSPRLQQALFFSPLPGGLLKLLFLGSGRKALRWTEDPSDHRYHKVLANPFNKYLRELGVYSGNIDKRKEAFLREDASWRRMLVCQPPTNNLAYPPDRWNIPDPCGHPPMSKQQTGLTYQDVMDAMGKFSCPLSIRVLYGTADWEAVEFGFEVERVIGAKPDQIVCTPSAEIDDESDLNQSTRLLGW